MHQLLEVADADLGAVSTAACQNKQLYERLERDVALRRVVPQDLNNLVLLKLNFLLHRVLQEVLQGQRLLTIGIDRSLADCLRKRKVRPDAVLVILDHVALLNDKELVNKLFEGASATANSLLKSCLGRLSVTLLN